eukprot:2017411-Rhodomonas_salina.2
MLGSWSDETSGVGLGCRGSEDALVGKRHSEGGMSGIGMEWWKLEEEKDVQLGVWRSSSKGGREIRTTWPAMDGCKCVWDGEHGWVCRNTRAGSEAAGSPVRSELDAEELASVATNQHHAR